MKKNKNVRNGFTISYKKEKMFFDEAQFCELIEELQALDL